MLAGFLLGFAHDRRPMREAQADIALRRFIGCGLDERLPDHSSLTRIRRRRGEARFRKIFRRTVSACVDAGIAKGEVAHVDATLIRADAGWKSMVDRHADAVASGNGDATAEEGASDGDASLAASRKGQRPEPCFKQHTAVDDENGVVLDVAVTTGEAGEGDMIEAQVDEVRSAAGQEIGTAAADAGYAFAKVYGGLERRGIDPLIPAKREPAKSRVPLRRFRSDAKHDIMKCPRGKALRPGKPRKHGRFFHAKAKDCARCPLKGDCLSKQSRCGTAVIGDDCPALLRGRRRTLRRSEEDRQLYRRHFWRSEGFHGETKTQHGLRRAVRRGLGNMKIQSCPTAAAINLKRLAAAFHARFPASGMIRMREMLVSAVPARWAGRIVQRPHALFLLVRGP